MIILSSPAGKIFVLISRLPSLITDDSNSDMVEPEEGILNFLSFAGVIKSGGTSSFFGLFKELT